MSPASYRTAPPRVGVHLGYRGRTRSSKSVGRGLNHRSVRRGERYSSRSFGRCGGSGAGRYVLPGNVPCGGGVEGTGVGVPGTGVGVGVVVPPEPVDFPAWMLAAFFSALARRS